MGVTRPKITEIMELGDFATNYQWNLVEVKGGPANPGNEQLNLRCTSATIPKATNQKITIEIRGHKIFQPGPLEYEGQITLSFVEVVDSAINTWISNWREDCTQTITGTHKKRKDVEAVITIERLDRQDSQIWLYKLYGCFLESYDPGAGELVGSGGDAMKPTLTISYNYFTDEAKGGGGGGAPAGG